MVFPFLHTGYEAKQNRHWMWKCTSTPLFDFTLTWCLILSLLLKPNGHVSQCNASWGKAICYSNGTVYNGVILVELLGIGKRFPCTPWYRSLNFLGSVVLWTHWLIPICIFCTSALDCIVCNTKYARKDDLVTRALSLESGDLGSVPSSTTDFLRDLGQFT